MSSSANMCQKSCLNYRDYTLRYPNLDSVGLSLEFQIRFKNRFQETSKSPDKASRDQSTTEIGFNSP